MSAINTYEARPQVAPHEDPTPKTLFGFWVYVMSDCLLFATLFAAYAVLHQNTYGGPSGSDLFSLPFVLAETLLLLVSSFTSGLALLAAYRHKKSHVLLWFFITFLLGAGFLGLELHEFSTLVREGHSWKSSAFLSSFFTLVGTHGAHITAGLIWMATLIVQIFFKGITRETLRRTACLGIFWHFLDIVWIFIFTIVYLMGVAHV